MCVMMNMSIPSSKLLRMYCCALLCFFFFKQKSSYDMRISDWSSDVCSSDLADGIAQQSAALVQRIEQDARQRLEWGQRMGTAVDDLQRVAGQLQRVSAGIWWDRLKEWLSAALIGLGLIFAAALAYQWAKEPKIEQRLYG